MGYNRSWDSTNALYSFCIKYNRLDQILLPSLQSMKFKQPPECINVYLNLNEMFKMYHPECTNHPVNNDFSLASTIINIAGHYNNFIRSKINMKVKIHLIYGSYSPAFNRIFYPEYNLSRMNKVNNDRYSVGVINDNLDIMETLCKYIPNVYLHRTLFEPGVMMYHLIQIQDKDAHIVIDKDQYNYQLVSDNCCIFRPKKNHDEKTNTVNDVSYVVHIGNVFDVYCGERNMKITQTTFDIINHGLYTLFLAMNGTNLRGLPARGKRATCTAKILETAILQDAIINEHNTLMQDSNIIIYSKLDDLYNYYCALDIPTQYKAFKGSPDADKVQFIDLLDKDAIHDINNNYFRYNPIILDNF